MADQENHISEILDHLLEGCQIIGYDWQYLYLNDAACAHAHLSREELIGHKMMEVYPGIEITDMFQQLNKCMEQRQPVRFSNDFSYPDLTSGSFEISVIPVKEGILVTTLDQSMERERSIAENESGMAGNPLAESENRFRTLIDQAPIAIAVSRESKFMYVNPAYLAMHGLSNLAEIMGRPIYERVSAQSLEESKERAYRRLHGQFVKETYEYTGLRVNGSEFDALASVTRVNLVDGLATIGFFQDISELKHAQQEIRASEARYRNLFDNMLEGVALCQMVYEDGRPVDFIYLHINEAFSRLTGLRNVEGKKVSDIIPGVNETNPELFEIYGRVTLTGNREKFETYLPALKIWLIVSVYSPETGKFVTVFENSTARRQAENALKQSNEELEQRVRERTAELSDLYNNAPCGYHSLDAKGVFVRINDTELNWLGYTRDEIVGKKKFTDLVTAESLLTFEENFPGFIKRGWVNNLEFRVVCKDGSILPVLLSGTAVKDSEGNYLYSRSTMIDNTEQKRGETARQETQKRLEAANVELEAFTYSVSHNLRAPLRAIDGFSRILSQEYAGDLDSEANRLLTVIEANTRRMDQLITDLLNLSRISRAGLHFSDIDMTSLATSVFTEISTPEIRQEFSVQIDPLPAANSDLNLIRQVWSNLLSNAIKYTRPKAERLIEVGGYLEKDSLIYYVKDSGVGFNPAYTNKLFGVFERLHKAEEFEGTGVGLAIVRRIINRLGGLTWAEGKLDQGATFYFSLPVKNNK